MIVGDDQAGRIDDETGTERIDPVRRLIRIVAAMAAPILEELVEKLNLKRDLSRNPLFDTVFVSFKFDVPHTQIEGLKFTPYPLRNGIAKFDLTLQAAEEEHKINFGFEYCTRLFKEETIARMGKDLIKILEAAIADPDIKIKEIKLVEGLANREKVINEEIEFNF